MISPRRIRSRQQRVGGLAKCDVDAESRERRLVGEAQRLVAVGEVREPGCGRRPERATEGEVERIIAHHRPKAFLLENVKNLVSHDKGRTLSTILDVLRSELGYTVTTKVINGKHFVPQHRERIMIVGFREDEWKKALASGGGDA